MFVNAIILLFAIKQIFLLADWESIIICDNFAENTMV